MVKNNNTQNWVFGFILIVCVLILYLIFGKKEARWYETYRADDDMPYGSEVLYDMLEVYYPDNKVRVLNESLTKSLELDDNEHANYVFVGQRCHWSKSSLEQLLSFVEKGNDAFIATKNLPPKLCARLNGAKSTDTIYPIDNSHRQNIYYHDSSAILNFSHPDLRTDKGFEFTHYYKDRQTAYDWHTINEISPLQLNNISSTIGTIGDGDINFVQIPYGDGFFYIHSTPFAFTNFVLITDPGREYFNRVFSHLKAGDIYWDKYSKIPVPSKNKNGAVRNADGPLNFILSHRSLSWAWYLLLFMVFLFLIFSTKRKQRIIPVAFENVNTSLEFVKTIALLYFKQNNHKQLAELKMKYLLSYIRNRYNIIKDDEALFIEKVAMKSGIPLRQIQHLLSSYADIENSEAISTERLVAFHNKIELFYKNAK